MSILLDVAAQRQAQTLLDEQWSELKKHSDAIVRQMHDGRVHVRTGAIDVVYAVSDLPALEAAVAMLRALGGRR